MKDWAGSMETRNYSIKRQTEFRHMVDLVWIVSSVALLAAVSVARSWERSQIVAMGYESQRLEELEENLRRVGRALVVEEATLKTPERIDGIARQVLDMAPARANQLLPVRYPDVERLRSIARDASSGTGSLALVGTPQTPLTSNKSANN